MIFLNTIEFSKKLPYDFEKTTKKKSAKSPGNECNIKSRYKKIFQTRNAWFIFYDFKNKIRRKNNWKKFI